MARGGTRLGAGRPRGSRSSKTLERLAQIDSTGVTPLAYLLTVLRDEGNPMPVRMDAAKAAAQYVHPRLAAVDTTLKGEGEPIRISLVDGRL